MGSGPKLGLRSHFRSKGSGLESLHPLGNGKAGTNQGGDGQDDDPEKRTDQHQDGFNEDCFHIIYSKGTGQSVEPATAGLLSSVVVAGAVFISYD